MTEPDDVIDSDGWNAFWKERGGRGGFHHWQFIILTGEKFRLGSVWEHKPEFFVQVGVYAFSDLKVAISRRHLGTAISSVVYLGLYCLGFIVGSARQDVRGVLARRAQSKSVPGSFLRSFARMLFGRRACDRVFDQVIAEMQYEHRLAIADGSKWEARMAIVRGWIAFAMAAGTHMRIHAILKTVGEFKKLLS